ncbi:MAG: cytochrome D1 [Acidobacteria bacterium]|nr:cytochrome D1 [Acidobacteriota bacterium]
MFVFLACGFFPFYVASGQTPPVKQRIVHEGIAIELSIQPLSSNQLREGEDVIVRFTIRDTATNSPVRTLQPAAWVNLRTDATTESRMTPAKACRDRVQEFLSGSVFAQADIDLNSFYVLAMNDDASISVVDPRFGFGGSKLLAMIPLKSVAADWILSADESRLFVSMPEANQVAVIDTNSWRVLANVDTGRNPAKLALQADQRYLWATTAEGITAIATDKLTAAARIPVARANEVAISDDSRWLTISSLDGIISIIDIRTLQKVAEVKTGEQPASLAFSGLSKMFYAASANGQISVIDASRQLIVARIAAEAGLSQIRFAPGGRVGFAVNPKKNVVYIFDAADNRLKQTADVEKSPDQITFTDSQAYVRHRDSETVLMIPLKSAGVAGQTVPVIDFPGGQKPFGQVSRPALADGIVPAPGSGAALVANPADKSIYFYKEGMAAPMGNFSNYGREPRAVLVVDRSLRERHPGVYETTTRLARAGVHDVSLFLDSPRLVHCFEIAVESNPELAAKRASKPIIVTPLIQYRNLKVGETARLQFRLTDPNTKQPKTELKDVGSMVMLAPGVWHKRQAARAIGDGVYEVEFAPPQPGVYYVYLESQSAGLSVNNSQYLVLQAQTKEERKENNE